MHVPRPIVPTIVAVVALMIAGYIASSMATIAAAGEAISARGWVFLVLLGVIALLASSFAVMKWVQRRHYVRSTTDEQRDVARAAARTSRTTNASATAAVLDYGERIDGGER